MPRFIYWHFKQLRCGNIDIAKLTINISLLHSGNCKCSCYWTPLPSIFGWCSNFGFGPCFVSRSTLLNPDYAPHSMDFLVTMGLSFGPAAFSTSNSINSGSHLHQSLFPHSIFFFFSFFFIVIYFYFINIISIFFHLVVSNTLFI